MFVSVTVYTELVFFRRKYPLFYDEYVFQVGGVVQEHHFMNIDSEIEANSLQSANSSESIGEL